MFGIPRRWIKIYSSVIAISLVSKVTGFFRDALITARFGATMVTDAYVVALLIPEVLFNIFGNSLSANFAPIYYEAERANRHRRFVATLFSLYLLLAILIFALGFKYSGFLITFFSSGFSGPAFELTDFLLKIFLANLFFLTVTYYCLAFLQARNNFLIPSAIGVFYNLALITSMYNPNAGNGLRVLIAGTLIGYFAQFAVQLPQAIARGLPMPTWRLSISPEIKKYFILSLPVAFLAILGQLNIAMDNYFASRLGAGSITTLSLGYRVLMGVYSTLITNTMMVVYPVLSRSIVKKDLPHAMVIIQKTTNGLIIILIPLAVYLFCNAQPIIDLMFKRGAFTARQSAITAMVFQGYIVGLFFYAFRDLLFRFFYAAHHALTPMLNGLANSAINLVYLILLVPLLGLPGISLATALSAVSSCLVLYWLAKKKTPAFRQLNFFGLLLKILLAAVGAIIPAILSEPTINGILPGEDTLSQLLRQGAEFIIFYFLFGVYFLLLFRKKIFGFAARRF